MSNFCDTYKNTLGKAIKDHSDLSAETFDISGKVDTSNPIYRFYEKDIGKYLKNKYGAELVKDKQGVSWWQLPITKSMAKDPIQAFGQAALGGILGVTAVGLGSLAANAHLNPVVSTKLEQVSQQVTNVQEKVQEKPINPVTNKGIDVEDYVKNIKVTIKPFAGSVASKLNNPGNLKFMGQPNAKNVGGFASYPTPELGFRALIKQVQADQKRKSTLEDFITKYAPSKENDTEKYIREVASELGITRKTKIDTLDPIELAKKIAKFESQTTVEEL